MSNKVSTSTGTYTAATKTISGITMSPVFELADQTEQRQVFFTIGTTLYYGKVLTFVSASSVILQPNGSLPAGNGTIANLFLLDLSEDHSYEDFLNELKSLIKQDKIKLTETSGGDLEKILAKAVTDWGKDVPLFIRKAVTGDGTSDYLLSTIFSGLWKHGYSQIFSIEYPTGENPPCMLEEDEYGIYDDGTAQDGSNLKLRFVNDAPSATQTFIVKFNAEPKLPTAGTKNFPDTDMNFSAITTLAAVYGCQRLAAAYAQSIDSTIGADAVNYNEKTAKYRSLAKQYMETYNKLIFGDEEPESNVKAAIVQKDIQSISEVSEDTSSSYLFHRRTRR